MRLFDNLSLVIVIVVDPEDQHVDVLAARKLASVGIDQKRISMPDCIPSHSDTVLAEDSVKGVAAPVEVAEYRAGGHKEKTGGDSEDSARSRPEAAPARERFDFSLCGSLFFSQPPFRFEFLELAQNFLLRPNPRAR